MVSTRLLKFFIPTVALIAGLVAACPADAEVVALHRGSGTFGLFHNEQISPVFADKLQHRPPSGATSGTTTITEITGAGVVQDTQFWGGADKDSTGMFSSRGSGNAWDEPAAYGDNNGIRENTRLGNLALLKFDVAQANGLVGGTIQKAELRLFFDSGFGPDDDTGGGRVFGDQIGRIVTNDWVEGNKANDPPGRDASASEPNGPAPGVSRRHPVSLNSGGKLDINNSPETRTRGRWLEPDGSGELLGSDYSNDGVVDGDDLARWQANFGSPTPPPTGFNYKFPIGDDDLDGDVDGGDFLKWQINHAKVAIENEDRSWFSTTYKGGDVTYQAPTWGDGNDYFNPDSVDYTANPDFPLVTLDGVDIYAPKIGLTQDSNQVLYPVSPNDGVSPGDGDVANEVNSIDATSTGDASFDYAFGATETVPFLGGDAGFDVWDVTGLIQALADGADNFGFYVRDNLRTFALSETTNGLDFAPVLFIDYTPAASAVSVPEPASGALLGLVLLGGISLRRFTRNRQRAC